MEDPDISQEDLASFCPVESLREQWAALEALDRLEQEEIEAEDADERERAEWDASHPAGEL